MIVPIPGDKVDLTGKGINTFGDLVYDPKIKDFVPLKG